MPFESSTSFHQILVLLSSVFASCITQRSFPFAPKWTFFNVASISSVCNSNFFSWPTRHHCLVSQKRCICYDEWTHLPHTTKMDWWFVIPSKLPSFPLQTFNHCWYDLVLYETTRSILCHQTFFHRMPSS